MVLLVLALEEPLYTGHTLGVWGESVLGANYLQGTREGVDEAGFSMGGEIGLCWWAHHNFGLRARLGLEEVSLKPPSEGEAHEYYWQAWMASGGGAVRLLGENRRALPYFGGFGGFVWELSGIKVKDGQGQDLDSLRSFPVFGGFLGVMVRTRMYQMLTLEAGGGPWNEDIFGYIRAGYTFKLLW